MRRCSVTKMLLLLTVISTVNLITSNAQRLIGTVYGVTNAGLLNVYEHSNGNAQTRYSILASSYDTGRSTFDNAFVLYQPGLAMSSGFEGYGPRLIYNVLYWPKEIAQVPNQVFNFDAIVIPDGSTISGKTTGSIYITNVDDFSFPATHDTLEGRLPTTSTYMYAGATWLRADAGLTWDIITCRVLVETGIVKEAQLVLIEQPTRNEMDSQWTLSVLKESACDSNVDITSITIGGGITGTTYDVIYTTGFYTQRLTLFYTDANLGYWTDPNDIVGVVIDQGRQFYDIKLVDINNDGKVDILTTVVDRTNGSVEVWEIPSDFRISGNYVRHVIASGFSARTGGNEGRSPGVARAFYPTGSTNQKPWIALTGADDGRAYVLRPTSQDSNNWDYEQTTLADYGLVQTVSGIAAADVNGDGYAELFVSVHNLNYVQVFSYSPANQD